MRLQVVANKLFKCHRHLCTIIFSPNDSFPSGTCCTIRNKKK